MLWGCNMKFSRAINNLTQGKVIKREDWSIDNAIEINYVDDTDMIFSIADVLAEDWEVLDE